MEIVYSFIIPHKNVPHLLKRCLDSIPERPDIETIIVDDNSDLSTIGECDFPGTNRLNTKIIFLDHSRSKGAGRARNEGLKVAVGRWILFADADDFFTDKLPALLDKYKDDEVHDIVYLNSQIVNDRKEYLSGPFSNYFERYKLGREHAEEVLRYYMWTPWSRMVKKRIIDDHNIVFDEIPVANDRVFSLNCSKYANTINVEYSIIYNYYKPETGSITDKYAMKTSNVLSRLNTQQKVNQLYREVHFPYLGSFSVQFLSYLRMVENKKELCSVFYKFIRENKICLLSDLRNLCRRQVAKLRGVI